MKHGGAARYGWAAPLFILFSEAGTPFTSGLAASIGRTTAQLYRGGAVVQRGRDPTGNPSEEGKGSRMPVPERLGTLPLTRPHEEGIGIQQGHHEKADLAQYPAHRHQRMCEVHLGLSRWMLQGQEGLLARPLELPNHILDDRITSFEYPGIS